MIRTLALVTLVGLSFGCSAIRGLYQKPDEIVTALDIQPGDRVADLGAGGGYFVPFLADAVSERGRVYAVDVEAEIVDELRDDLHDRTNVEVVLGDYDDPKLPDGQVDLVLIVNTYHHIEERPDYFARLRTDLSPSGRVAVIEPDAELSGFLSWFLEDGHTSRRATVVAEMQQAGYDEVARHEFLPVQLFVVFAPAR